MDSLGECMDENDFLKNKFYFLVILMTYPESQKPTCLLFLSSKDPRCPKMMAPVVGVASIARFPVARIVGKLFRKGRKGDALPYLLLKNTKIPKHLMCKEDTLAKCPRE